MIRSTTFLSLALMLMMTAIGCTASKQRIVLGSELSTAAGDRVRSVHLVDGRQVMFADDGATVNTSGQVTVEGVTESNQKMSINAARIANAQIESNSLSIPWLWITVASVGVSVIFASAIAGSSN